MFVTDTIIDGGDQAFVKFGQVMTTMFHGLLRGPLTHLVEFQHTEREFIEFLQPDREGRHNGLLSAINEFDISQDLGAV